MTTHCFYHSGDLDGRASAAIFYNRYYNDKINWHPIDYGNPFPWSEINNDDRVYMFDYSLNLNDMLRLRSSCRFVWIDHHKTAIERLSADDDLVYDFDGIQEVGIGACALVYRYFYPNQALPKAINYLAHYDVFSFPHKDVLPFQYGMRTEDTRIKSLLWPLLLKNDDESEKVVSQIVSKGLTILEYNRIQNEIQAQSKSFEMTFAGLRLIAMNHGPANSTVFDSVYDENTHDAMCLFYWNSKCNQWKVSLYANKNTVDVGAICKRYGGGGHAGAAGFHCERLPFFQPRLTI